MVKEKLAKTNLSDVGLLKRNIILGQPKKYEVVKTRNEVVRFNTKQIL